MPDMDEIVQQVQDFWKRTVAYFTALPDKDPIALGAWGAIALGIVLIVVAFVVF